jgi:hypothetical protein
MLDPTYVHCVFTIWRTVRVRCQLTPNTPNTPHIDTGNMALASKSMQMSRARVARPSRASRARVARVSAKAATSNELGFKTMRDGIKEASDETILTPRFYTT